MITPKSAYILTQKYKDNLEYTKFYRSSFYISEKFLNRFHCVSTRVNNPIYGLIDDNEHVMYFFTFNKMSQYDAQRIFSILKYKKPEYFTFSKINTLIVENIEDL